MEWQRRRRVPLCVGCVDVQIYRYVYTDVCCSISMDLSGCVCVPAWRVGPARHRSWPATATPPPAPPHEGSTADRTCSPIHTSTGTTGLSLLHWVGLAGLSMATIRVSWQASSCGAEADCAPYRGRSLESEKTKHSRPVSSSPIEKSARQLKWSVPSHTHTSANTRRMSQWPAARGVALLHPQYINIYIYIYIYI
jgi:hypothetical protein